MAMMKRGLILAISVLAVASCAKEKKADPGLFAKDWRKLEFVNFTVYTPPDTPRRRQGLESFGQACDDTYEYIARQLKIEVVDDIGIYLFTRDEDCVTATGRTANFAEKLNIFTRIGAPIGGLIAETMCNSLDPEAPSFKLVRDGVRTLFDERDVNIHYEALSVRKSRPWPSLDELVTKQSFSDPTAYKYACASFVAFLIQRYGTDQFHALWRSSLDLPTSLQRIYGGSLPEMEAEWIRVQDALSRRT